MTDHLKGENHPQSFCIDQDFLQWKQHYILHLLLVTFSALNTSESTVNEQEIQLAKSFEQILKQPLENFNEIKILEENTLDFQKNIKKPGLKG